MKGILERTILIIRHIDGPLAKNLIKDIEEVLAQPEQPKREPLSDEERQLVYDEAYIMAKKYSMTIRGQTVTEADSIDYWTILATEKAHGIGEK
jgi:hypothetical protein